MLWLSAGLQSNIWAGVCFIPSSIPHPSLFTPPSSAPVEQRQLPFVGDAFLSDSRTCVYSLTLVAGTPLCYLQHHRWWWWGGDADPEDNAKALCLLSLLCTDSALFFSHFHWRLHMCGGEAAVSSRHLSFLKNTSPLCSATWEIFFLLPKDELHFSCLRWDVRSRHIIGNNRPENICLG